MTDALLLGIDVGTSSCKAAVLDPAGEELAIARMPLPWRRCPDGAELDAQALTDTVLSTAQRVLREAPGGKVLAVGVASMAEAGFPLDAAGRALAPAMAWHDTRAAGELASLRDDVPDFAEVTGLPASPRPPAVRHRWRSRAGAYPSTPARWLNVAEFVVHALGGEQVTEPSLASRTGWLDVEALHWWPVALGWSDADERLLPELRPAGAPAGWVRGPRALEGAALTVAGHDHLSAAVGAGALDPVTIVDSCGTAEVLLRAVPGGRSAADRRRAVERGFTSGRHVLPGLHALIGGFPSGALLGRLAAALGLTGPEQADRIAAELEPGAPPSLAELERLVARVEEEPAAGADTGRLWRTAVEGVAAHAARVLARLEELTGPRATVSTVGGSTHGSLVADARRRHLGPLSRPRVREAAARGAALAGGVAVGLFDDLASVPAPGVDAVEEPSA